MEQNPYYEYFQQQVGGGAGNYSEGIGEIYNSYPEFQRGYGGILSRNRSYHRAQLGQGFSSWISRLFRIMSPVLKRGVKEVADITSKVASDTIQGANLGDSLKKHTSDRAAELIEQAPAAFTGFINKRKGAGIRSRSSNSSVSVNRGSAVSNRLLLMPHKTSSPVAKKGRRKKPSLRGHNSNKKFPALSLIK
jgi:hypothetical protein